MQPENQQIIFPMPIIFYPGVSYLRQRFRRLFHASCRRPVLSTLTVDFPIGHAVRHM